MGAWGSKLFQDDEAQDVRVDFEAKIDEGKEPASTADEILAAEASSLNDPDSGPTIYLSLAYLLHESGVQDHPVIQKALSVIDEEEGLDRWVEMGARSLASRKRVYQELKQQLSSPVSLPKARRKRTKLPKLFDVMEMKLPDGRYVYGQYVSADVNRGPFVQFFKLISDTPVPMEEAMASGPMFSPVVVGINPPVREGKWRIIGNVPLENFKMPLYREANHDAKGRPYMWYLYDGQKSSLLGPELPKAYEDLEVLFTWGLDSLEKRIKAGRTAPVDIGEV